MNYTPPEPLHAMQWQHNMFTEQQLRDEVAKARREAIEECAESIDDACREQIMTASDCIDLIRNIK